MSGWRWANGWKEWVDPEDGGDRQSEEKYLDLGLYDANGRALLPLRIDHYRLHVDSDLSLLSENERALIAAAPDLLQACRMVLEMAVAWQPLTPGDIAEVKAAIAKAEGK